MADGDDTAPTNDTSNEDQESKDTKNGGWDGDFDPERYKADLSKKNAENKSLRARLKAYEDAEKVASDQSNEERLAALTKQNQQLQQKLWAAEVRDEFGLKPEHLKYISGSTLEELKANAEAFKKDVLGETSDEDEFELTEEELEASLSPFGGNRRPVTDVSRSRSTSEGAGDPSLDVEAIAREIMSPWG